jgi:hypothetical protein
MLMQKVDDFFELTGKKMKLMHAFPRRHSSAAATTDLDTFLLQAHTNTYFVYSMLFYRQQLVEQMF